jgi:hypothetical protein
MRRLPALVIAACTLIGTASAQAATTYTATCADLQAKLTGAVAGDTVILTEGQVCTAAGGYTLPSASVVFKGAGTGATIAPVSGRALIGNDIGTSRIGNLTLRGGNATGSSGGDLLVSGNSSPLLFGLHVLGGTADTGGGTMINATSPNNILIRDSTFGDGTAGGRNSAQFGGGLLISTDGGVRIQRSSFSGNNAIGGAAGAGVLSGQELTVVDSTFTGNAASGVGAANVFGGGLIGSGTSVTLTDDVFSANTLTPSNATGQVLGAGASVALVNANSIAELSGNVFRDNVIGARPDGGDVNVAGAGLVITGGITTSRHDRFTGNTIGAHGAAAAAGAGLAHIGSGCNPPGATLELRNAVIANNSIAGAAKGTGLGIDSCAGFSTSVTVSNSTIAGNAAGSDTAGAFGAATADITLRNTILALNTGGANLSGFDAGASATFSDLCAGSAPFAGTGNICADPLFGGLATGDIRQTASSPTIDKGSNALLPPGLNADFEFEPRVTDGDGDGSATVDIGADETKTYVAPVVAPPPPDAPIVFGAPTLDGVANPKVSKTGVLDTGQRLTCAAGTATCRADVTIDVGTRRTVIGHVLLTIPAGTARRVKVKLTKGGAKRFARKKKAHTVKVIMRVAAATGTGPVTRTSQPLRIKVAAKKRRKH